MWETITEILKKTLLGALMVAGISVAPAAFAQCAGDHCLAGASVGAGGDLLAMFSSADGDDLQVTNVSQLTGQGAIGPTARWQTPDGADIVEHLAGVNAAGDLIVFFWSSGTDSWGAVNVSGITGQRVLGPVANWRTQDGPYTVEHLAGISPDGRLLVFFWSPRADWQAVDVSAITGGQRLSNAWAPLTLPGQRQAPSGQQFAGPLASWQTQEGGYNVEHLAGASVDGDLLEFSWSPATDWRVQNLSATTGQRVAGPVASWQLHEGLFDVENLGGVNANGDLVVFFRVPLATWRTVNVSRIVHKKVAAPVTAWVKDGLDYIGAGGAKENGFYVFWNFGQGRKANPGWGFCPVSNNGCTPTLYSR